METLRINNPGKSGGEVVIERDKLGQFIPGNSKAITKETARELQVKSVESRLNRGRDAVLEVFKRGEDISWVEGWQKHVSVISEEVVFNPKSKPHEKTKGLLALAKLAGIDNLIGAIPPQYNTQVNVFADNPAAVRDLLDARCPDCDEVRYYGVEHVCVRMEVVNDDT